MSVSGAGTSVQAAGMIEQEIAGYIGSGVTSKNLQLGAAHAREQLEKGYGRAAEAYKPFYEGGREDYETYRRNVGMGTYDMANRDFNAPQEQAYAPYQQERFNFQADPGYQFRQQEGQNAIQASAMARGSGLSGATMKALAKYGQNVASEEYGNAYNRYSQNRAFNRGVYEDTRNFQRNQFVGNRAFDYGSFSDKYGREQQEMSNRANRAEGLGRVGQQFGQLMASLGYNYGQDLAQNQMQKYNARAAGWQGVMDTAMMQGQHAQDVGGGMGGKMGGGGSSSGGGGAEAGAAAGGQ